MYIHVWLYSTNAIICLRNLVCFAKRINWHKEHMTLMNVFRYLYGQKHHSPWNQLTLKTVCFDEWFWSFRYPNYFFFLLAATDAPDWGTEFSDTSKEVPIFEQDVPLESNSPNSELTLTDTTEVDCSLPGTSSFSSATFLSCRTDFIYISDEESGSSNHSTGRCATIIVDSMTEECENVR